MHGREERCGKLEKGCESALLKMLQLFPPLRVDEFLKKLHCNSSARDFLETRTYLDVQQMKSPLSLRSSHIGPLSMPRAGRNVEKHPRRWDYLGWKKRPSVTHQHVSLWEHSGQGNSWGGIYGHSKASLISRSSTKSHMAMRWCKRTYIQGLNLRASLQDWDSMARRWNSRA